MRPQAAPLLSCLRWRVQFIYMHAQQVTKPVPPQARGDERPMQPALEACVFDHGEAGAPTAAGAGGAAVAEERAAAGPGGASGEACAAALGQPKVALLFLTPGPLPQADVRPRVSCVAIFKKVALMRDGVACLCSQPVEGVDAAAPSARGVRSVGGLSAGHKVARS